MIVVSLEQIVLFEKGIKIWYTYFRKRTWLMSMLFIVPNIYNCDDINACFNSRLENYK